MNKQILKRKNYEHIEILFEISYICNNNCTGCYYPQNVKKILDIINKNKKDKENKPTKKDSEENYSKKDLDSIDAIENKLEELKKMVGKAVIAQKKPLKTKKTDYKTWAGELGELQKNLEWHGVTSSNILKICGNIEKRLETRENSSFPTVKDFFIEEVQSLISISHFDLYRTEQSILSLLGPTGIGKTTTIAKLSSNFKNKHENVNIAYITIDTYKIGATEQIQGYGDIMDIPTEVVFNIADMKKHLREYRLKNFEVIFIDTAGRSPNDDKGLNSLCDFVCTDDIKKFIVLSANLKERDMENNFEKFSISRPSGCIITKLDETKKYGFLLNMSKHFLKYPIYCMTHGQDADGKIEFPNHKLIANIFYKTND